MNQQHLPTKSNELFCSRKTNACNLKILSQGKKGRKLSDKPPFLPGDKTSEDKLSSSKQNRNPHGRLSTLREHSLFSWNTSEQYKIDAIQILSIWDSPKKKAPTEPNVRSPTQKLERTDFLSQKPSQKAGLREIPFGQWKYKRIPCKPWKEKSYPKTRWRDGHGSMDHHGFVFEFFASMIHALLRRSHCLTWLEDMSKHVKRFLTHCLTMSTIPKLRDGSTWKLSVFVIMMVNELLTANLPKYIKIKCYAMIWHLNLIMWVCTWKTMRAWGPNWWDSEAFRDWKRCCRHMGRKHETWPVDVVIHYLWNTKWSPSFLLHLLRWPFFCQSCKVAKSKSCLPEMVVFELGKIQLIKRCQQTDPTCLSGFKWNQTMVFFTVYFGILLMVQKSQTTTWNT